ncbi:MAG: elongation factor P maturation arginine rhamnosyltransferase EarP [Burkholderiales bacterium]
MTRTWDVFCRVIDNHGDLGVAWRLCADLAGRGEHVRLWVDDASALSWMAPHGHAGVQIVHWTDRAPDLTPAEVVVESFGCDPPARFVQRMAAMDPAPLWINLEYLSAEPYAERSHGLLSPVQVAPGRVLDKRFHFPGFTLASGGLLREQGLLEARRVFDRDRWLHAQRIASGRGERLVSLFCYANTALPALLDVLAAEPTLLLVTPGASAAQVHALVGAAQRRGALRACYLPYLTQVDYDCLLWACDLNFVRGEDSFVRAQWAGKPFVWQAYPQPDDVRLVKVDAFLDRFLAGVDPKLAKPLRHFWRAWNASAATPQSRAVTLPDAPGWRARCEAWRDALTAQPDLVTKLLKHAEQTR